MPKAKTESTELQVFNLDNLNPALLPELATFKESQLKVVAENPFVAIVDVASRELAKKHRTARVSARTSLQGQDKLISSKFNEAKAKAKSYIAELIDYTLPGEVEQQTEINRDEAEAELKRQAKALAEQKRIEAIKKEIEDYSSQWIADFNVMGFESIEKVSADFLESYTSFDTTILQEFEALFPVKVEELTQRLSDKKVSLTNVENARLENIRLEKEAAELRIEKARLEALAKIAIEAEAKAKVEREAFEKEKADFEAKQIVEKQKSEHQLKVDGRISQLTDLGLQFDFQSTFVGFNFFIDILDIKCYDNEKWDSLIAKIEEVKSTPLTETPPIAKVEIPEILVPELPTVNVCTSEEIKNITVYDAEIVKNNNDELHFEKGKIPEISAFELSKEYAKKALENNITAWDDVEKYFKASGEKSYSKWLKNNYNVPTKIQ